MKNPAGNAIALLLALAGTAAAQSMTQYSLSNIYDGTPPVAIDPGGPSGNFPLSGIDHVNLYSGKVSASLPLLTLKGRGKISLPLSLNIRQIPWNVATSSYLYCSQAGVSNTCNYKWNASAGQDWWDPVPSFMAPGRILIHRSGANPVNCTPGPDSLTSPQFVYQNTFTYVSFIGPDGIENNLYDTSGIGAVNNGVNSLTCSPPETATNRGATFVSRDGKGMTFVAALPIDDDPNVMDYPNYSASATGGTLYFKDGTKYSINGDGLVDYAEDTNGNWIRFTYGTEIINQQSYGTQDIAQAVDSAGRTVDILYNVADQALGRVTTVSYKGATGTPRVIKIQFAPLQSQIRSDLAQTPTITGPAGKVLLLSTASGTQPVVAAVYLPNNQSYQFYYTAFGEVARIVLPTGGAIEYDYSGGVNQDPANGIYPEGQLLDDVSNETQTYSGSNSFPLAPWTPVIYRRVTAKRTYTAGGSIALRSTATSVTTYSLPESLSAGANSVTRYPADNKVQALSLVSAGYVQETESGSNIPAPIVTRHYFHSLSSKEEGFQWGITSPASPAMELLSRVVSSGSFSFLQGYPDAFQGKEFETEIPNVQTTQQVWGVIDAATNDAEVCQASTTVYGSGTSTRGRFYLYDKTAAGSAAAQILENVTDTYEYDYGNIQALVPVTQTSSVRPSEQQDVAMCPASVPANYSRRTHTDYVADSGYVNASIKTLPSQRITYCSGAACNTGGYSSKTLFYYDNNSLPNTCDAGTVAGLTSFGAIATQDPAYSAASGSPARGNLNCMLDYYYSAGSEHTVDLTYEYDQTGNLLVARDGNHHATTFTYAPSCGSYANNHAFRTGVTNALGQTTQIGFDCDLGVANSVTDANLVKTTYSYNSPDNGLDRLASVVEAATSVNSLLPAISRQTTYHYVDSIAASASDDTAAHASVQVSKDVLASGDQMLNSTIYYDGMGRQIESSLSETAGTINTVTDYDGLGRVLRRSNPVRGVPQLSDKTVFTYDALDRVTGADLPDGSHESIAYDRNMTTMVDAALVSRTSTVDGLGRMIQVTENNTGDPQASTYTTTYSYNANDDLVQVLQGAQTRCFYYDELRRLTSAIYPEIAAGNPVCSAATVPASGAVTYAYDNAGNLVTKTSAAGIVTNYSPAASPIDALNRVTRKTYSDATPAVSFTYDSCTGGVGRLCGSSAGAAIPSVTSYSYDALGRVAGTVQTTNGQPYPLTYTYNMQNGVRTMQYPSMRTVTYDYDSDARVIDVKGLVGTTPNTYVSNIQYAPQGVPNVLSFHNGLTEQTCFNNRLQMSGFRLGMQQNATNCAAQGGDLFQLALDYHAGAGDNGNLWGVTQQTAKNDGTPLTIAQTMTYDGVNRLMGVSESGNLLSWNMMFGYDRFGNRWASSTIPLNLATATQQAQFDATTNRIVEQSNGTAMPADAYDGDGNLRDHPAMGQMQYDAEGRLMQFTALGSAVSKYYYDGAGQRVWKAAAGVTTAYVYDTSGNVIAEYGGMPGPASAAGTTFVTADQLGSTRVVTDGSGHRVSCSDYFPFGEEMLTDVPSQIRSAVACYGIGTGFADKFTGKERDSESGLDYFGARYSSSAQGRFTSPDEFTGGAGGAYAVGGSRPQQPGPLPYADLTNPQSLNEYVYALNNPLRYIDPDGHEETDANDPNKKTVPPPTLPDGRLAPPPVPLPPGKSGKPNDWVYVPNDDPAPGQRPGRWKPKEPVPNPKGSQPSGSWDPEGHWDVDIPNPAGGRPDRQRFLPDGTPVGPDHQPIPGNPRMMIDPQTAGKGAAAIGTGALIYWIISEGSRLFPPRNLIPIP